MFPFVRSNMGEFAARFGLDELSGGAVGVGRAVLAEFIGKWSYNFV